MHALKKQEVDSLALGSAVLGSGGGGNPHIGAMLLKQAMEDEHIESVAVTPFDEIDSSHFLISSAGIGSPAIGIEKIANGQEYHFAFRKLEEFLSRRASHVSPVEIGGINSLIPFIAAIRLKLPVADGDGEGRAFPELQMTTFSALGLRASPMCIVDEKRNSCIVQGIDDVWTERIARTIAVRFGGRGCVALYPLRGDDYRSSAIPDSLSLALNIGESLSEGIKKKDAEQSLISSARAKRIFCGKIVDVKRFNTRGFAIGHVLIDGTDEHRGERVRVLFQNEYLLLKRMLDGGEEETVLSTPQIISVHDQTTLLPITTDHVRYGMRCTVYSIPVSSKWHFEGASKIVGPEAFKLF